MRTGLAALAIAAGLFCLLATVAARAAPAADLTQQWAGYWNAKNLDSLMALYAPDPVVLTASGERLSGAADIRKRLVEDLAQFDPRLVMTSLASKSSGDLAYDSGSYEETLAPAKGGAAVRESGFYLVVFARKSRAAPWRIVEQSWTRMPAPAPTPRP
ncbi:MAG TPA: DUF4440 domain-containing protein [Rhizomicrobium sp.]|jgi:ketosteroid isomerase-like protein|nr:DUF4440 domain-containing protein [Rhizomicrobium sp.]